MNLKSLSASIRRFLDIRGIRSALAAFVLLIVVYVSFGIFNLLVFSSEYLLRLLRSMSKYLLVGIAQSFVFITGNIDLSIGSIVCMSAMISARLIYTGVTVIPSIIITLVCCMFIGLINGVMVGRFKLPPYIATLGTMFITRGICYLVNNNRSTGPVLAPGISKEAADTFQGIMYYGSTLGVFNTFWIAFAVFIAFYLLLSKTRSGRHIYAVGSNRKAAELSGVNVSLTITKAYLVSAFCSFVVGLILCGQAGMGNMEAGINYEMYGVTASVIGGVLPLGGTGLLLGTLAGSAVWQTLESGLSMVGAPVGAQRVIIGVITALAVMLGVNFKSYRYSKRNSKS